MKKVARKFPDVILNVGAEASELQATVDDIASRPEVKHLVD